jgi:protein SCO1/2
VSVRRVAALVAAATLVLAGCGEDASAGTKWNGAVLDEPYVVPKAALTDTDGEPYSLASDTDRPLTLVFFGYTRCPDICQTVMSSLASAMTRLDKQDRERVDVVFVTTDPARDDGRTLRTYLDRFDPSFEGLTGDLSTIVRLGKAFGVFIEKGEKLPSGGYDVNHGTQVVGVLPDRRAPFVWTQGTPPSDLADDISAILDDKVPGL